MTAPVYDIVKEFDQHLPDQAATSPSAIIAIYRLKQPVSFDRSKMASINKMATEGAELRGDNPFIIVSDITSLSVQSSKSNYLHTMSAKLKVSEVNYGSEIFPGDWVMCWMVNDRDRAVKLVQRLKNGSSNGASLNDFDSGFKFMGRIQTKYKSFRQDGNGARQAEWNITAVAFKELSTQIVYFLDLAEEAYQNITTWMAKIGLDIRELFKLNQTKAGGRGLVNNGESVILGLLEIVLGKGTRKAGGGLNPGGAKGLNAAAGGATEPAPYAYLVPGAISNALGYDQQETVSSFASILAVISGRQTYSNSGSQTPAVRFKPDLEKGEGNKRKTGAELLGSYLPFPTSFVNRPVWELMMQFLNPTVNEAYTAFRVDDGGKIVPTLIIRQIPFSSDVFKDETKDSNNRERITRFMNLPRWKISSHLAIEGTIGQSDATRCNFVHIGIMTDVQAGMSITRQFAENKPVFDSLDIQRSGIHPYMTTVCAAPADQTGKLPRFWMELVADHRIGSHLTSNGTLTCHGIQAPICIGDNIEFDNMALHIESISHQISSDSEGNKTFTTTLTVTNGLYINTKDRGNVIVGGYDSDDAPRYPGMFENDNTQYDPGTASESTMAEPSKSSTSGDFPAGSSGVDRMA